jgi:hypothetical protein
MNEQGQNYASGNTLKALAPKKQETIRYSFLTL